MYNKKQGWRLKYLGFGKSLIFLPDVKSPSSLLSQGIGALLVV